MGDDAYKVKPPTPQQKVKATELYRQTMRDNRFGHWLTDSDCFRILLKNKLVTIDVDSNLQKIEKEIENLKVRAYNTVLLPVENKKVRKTLDMVKKKQEEIMGVRHSMDHLTLKGFAEMVKRQYLICTGLYYDNTDKLVWKNIGDVDCLFLEGVVRAVLSRAVSISQLREMARKDPWRSYWSVNKVNPFGLKSPMHLTDEQKTLILFSKMYDSAQQHPDCPPDNIINDDDLFDGWMIYERRKIEQEKTTEEMKKKMEKHRGNLANADEVFLVPKGDTQEEIQQSIKDINSMNSTAGQMIKAQRRAVVKKKGKAIDADFPDRKMDIAAAQNKQFIQTVKGNK